jgi:hypothetical protein
VDSLCYIIKDFLRPVHSELPMLLKHNLFCGLNNVRIILEHVHFVNVKTQKELHGTVKSLDK